jgi:branched-chain amino acid transport system permease protein
MRARSLVVTAVVLGVCIALELGLDAMVPDSSVRQLAMLAMGNMVVALSLNVINGMAGQFSIGHAGFLALGAYTAAIVTAHLHEMLGGGDPTFAHSFLVVPVALIAAALVAGLFGFVVGLPSLRLRGDYLAIVTLGFAEIVRLTIATAQVGGEQSGFAALVARLGGENGYAGPNNAGIPLYAGPFWIVGITCLAAVAAWRIKFSGWGRALRALREDEIASAAVGVDPTRYKVTSFVLSAMGGGVAGGMLAIMRDGTPIVQPGSYQFQSSFDAITMVILGGSGSVSGAMIGGVFVTLTVKLIELVQSMDAVQALKQSHPQLDLNALRMIVYAVVLVVLMVWRPEGLLGERELFARKKKAPAKAPAKTESEPAK